MDAIGLHDRGALVIAMFRQPLLQRIGDPDIKGPVTPARENVDVVHTRRLRLAANSINTSSLRKRANSINTSSLRKQANSINTSSLRKQGPITTGGSGYGRRRPSCHNEGPRSMGPCFRRDDES